MLEKLIYWLALGAVSLVRSLPLAVCFAFGQGVGALLWAILPGYRKLAKENLSRAFPEKSRAEIARLAFHHFTALGANAVSAFKIPALTQADILRIAPIEHLDYIKRNIAKGKGVVLAINHIGNWELYAQLIFQVPEARFGTVYQALRNKSIDDLVNNDRRRLGVQTFDRKKGFNNAIALLREPGIVGVLVDQNAGDGGVWTPFFNRLSSTSPLTAALAIRTESVVVPVAIFTSGFAKWRVVLSPEIPYDPANPEQLTYDINVALEKQIRQSPPDWFWVHNRWKMPWPNFLTAGQRRGTYLPPAYTTAASTPSTTVGTTPSGTPATTAEKPSNTVTLTPFRIVVRSPNWLGDAVMSLPAARAFKHGRPDARLAVLTPSKLAALWQSVPEVDEVITFEPRESVFAVAKKLRHRFDVIILFPNSFRSALEAWLAGIPRRVGFAGHHRDRLLNQIIPERKKKKALKPEHHADRYWRIAERCGAIEQPPPLATTTPSSPLVFGICPGAEYGPAKQWPAERFRKAMELISEKVPCEWLILGTAADQKVAAEILTGFKGKATDLTGKTTLEELAAKLRSLPLLLTNDTGTMHLADALGTPLVAIFGSTEPKLTGPRSARSTVLRHQVECSPCFLRECPLDFRCMKAVTPEEVSEAALRTISAKA